MSSPIISSDVSNESRPKLTSFGIRYFAFQANPNEPAKLLNPLWPTDKKRFLETEYAAPYQDPTALLLAKDDSRRLLFLMGCEINVQQLFQLAETDDKASALLQQLSLSAIQRLVTLVRNGNNNATRTLWEVAHLATTAIDSLGPRHPVIQEIAKEEFSWPGLKSHLPGLSSQTDIADLPLATNYFPELSSKSRAKLSNPVGIVAFRLYDYVRVTRLKAIHAAKKQGINLEHLRRTRKPEDLTIEESAALLPEFSKKTVVNWWRTAERCLVEAYQHLDLDVNFKPQLDEQTPVLKNLVSARSHLAAGPGTIRRKILEKLADKFYSFSGDLIGKDKTRKTIPSLK